MAREEWDRDRGYGGEYRRHGAWSARWGRRGREDRDRENRWMSDMRRPWRGHADYGAEYMPRHVGRRLEGGRWGEPGSWRGGWTRGGRGWRVIGRRAHPGYGAAYYGAAYGSPEYAPGQGRRRQHGGWGGFGGERVSGRGAYYGGEYGW